MLEINQSPTIIGRHVSQTQQLLCCAFLFLTAQHFPSCGMTLNERFTAYQRQAAEKETMKPRKSPEIHRYSCPSCGHQCALAYTFTLTDSEFSSSCFFVLVLGGGQLLVYFFMHISLFLLTFVVTVFAAAVAHG